MWCVHMLADAVVDCFTGLLLLLLLLFFRMGGGTGDESIRKVAYFEGARDPMLFKEGVSVPITCVCVCVLHGVGFRCYLLMFPQTRDKTHVVTYRCPSNCAVQVRLIAIELCKFVDNE